MWRYTDKPPVLPAVENFGALDFALGARRFLSICNPDCVLRMKRTPLHKLVGKGLSSPHTSRVLAGPCLYHFLSIDCLALG